MVRGWLFYLPKNSGWTQLFCVPPPPPRPALYPGPAWAPQKASVVRSSRGGATVWSAHLQPHPATSSHLEVSTVQISLNIPSRLLPCAGSCIFSETADVWCVWADPGPGLAASDHKIWTLGHKQLSWLMLATCTGGGIPLFMRMYLFKYIKIFADRSMLHCWGEEDAECRGLCSGYFQKLNHSIDFNKSQLSQQPIGWNILLYCIVRYLQNIISIQTGPNERDEQSLVLTLWTANINITATIASVHTPHPGGWCRAKCD